MLTCDSGEQGAEGESWRWQKRVPLCFSSWKKPWLLGPHEKGRILPTGLVFDTCIPNRSRPHAPNMGGGALPGWKQLVAMLLRIGQGPLAHNFGMTVVGVCRQGLIRIWKLPSAIEGPQMPSSSHKNEYWVHISWNHLTSFYIWHNLLMSMSSLPLPST